MMNSDEKTQFQIKVENFADTQSLKVKVMVCQLDFDQMQCSQKGRLHIVSNEPENQTYLRRFLNIASNQKVDLLVFPELTMPVEFVDEVVNFSKLYDIYVVGGTYYKKTEKGYLSICPIVTPQGVFSSEKINPSPFETSSFNSSENGAVPGEMVRVFRGSKIGDFAVTICLDYTDDPLRNILFKHNLDILIVTAFNPKSDDFFASMQSDVQRSQDGIYIVYCNTISKALKGEGRSALFALMDNCYKSEFKDLGCSDLCPPNKIYEFSESKRYCIFEIDLEHKKPYISKNAYTTTNVRVVLEDDEQMDSRYRFLKAIGATDDKYLFIDQYYVKPREYVEMCELLDTENVLVITGDPGIGKTYTAIRILQEYYNKGFKPTWFYGMEKEDRDEQKEHLLTFMPQEKDIVYIEDPFGRTVFENREELKTLFANCVERFRACRAKLIITSRAEVFKQFKKEVLSGEKLESYQKELNIRKPSYQPNDLIEIAHQYIKAYTSWGNNKTLIDTVILGITKGYLISPLMIYNLTKNYSQIVEPRLLKEAIRDATRKDLVTQFADEIKILTHPAKILLYLVLIYGKKNISLIRELFSKVQLALFEKTKFEGSSFAFELKGQEDHRIQRLGEQIPVYRFSHPTYEEALVRLTEKDSVCALIAETCLEVILKEDGSMAADIFKRFVIRYSHFLENVLIGVLEIHFKDFSETAKLDLAKKMLLSDNDNFKKIAKGLFPIDKVIESLYKTGDEQIFILRLRLLNRRKDELGTRIIDWERVFSTKRIRSLHPSAFIMCYDLAQAVDGKLMVRVEKNLQKADVIRKFILLPSESQRNKFNEILNTTAYKGIYNDLKTKIPEDILGERINKYKYVSVLRKYLLKKGQPKGEVYLDTGAMKAVAKGAKIYPVGVVDVVGDFENGDIIYLVNKETRKRVLSMVELSSENIRKYKGLHSPEIYKMEDKLVSTIISRPLFREYKPVRSRRK